MDVDDDAPRAAFEVDGELDPALGPPQDGFDYLRTVRYEAKFLSNINVSSVNPRHFDSKQSRFVEWKRTQFAMPIPALTPNEGWQQEFIQQFETLRTEFEQMRGLVGTDDMDHIELPRLRDEEGWRRLILGSTPGQSTETSRNSAPDGAASSTAPTQSSLPLPTTTLMLSMDLRTCARATDYLLGWMQQDDFVLSRHTLLWLFALLACLDRPTHADTGGSMRVVLRKLCSHRAGMTSVDDPLAADLNLIITIFTHSFGQVIEYGS